MPYLKIQTNTDINEDAKKKLIAKASATIADALGKPERYVMVAIDPPVTMSFAASFDPCAYMELKSIGLPETNTVGLSASLCSLVEAEIGVPAERSYIEFSDAPRPMWGWNSGTF